MDPTRRSVLDQIVDRLVAGYSPEKVILFGSYAGGAPDLDSDIDLLIVKPTSEPFWERVTAVRRAVEGAHPHIPLDPIVLTPAEVHGRVNAGDQFIAQIIENGQVLYSRF